MIMNRDCESLVEGLKGWDLWLEGCTPFFSPKREVM